MSLGRRKVRLEDDSAWVFNRMVDAYESRPPYPQALLDALLALSPGLSRPRVLDVGAGLGHLALPLAERGAQVVAIEPARAMLERLAQRAAAAALQVNTIQAMAETFPEFAHEFDLVLVADAVHFLDPARAAYELRRALSPEGTLAVVLCEFDDTPFMSAVRAIMDEAAPRRPRNVESAVRQLLAVAGPQQSDPQVFTDDTPVDGPTLEGILRSISFIGPAMNPQRYAAFRKRILSIEHERRWARRFTLLTARR